MSRRAASPCDLFRRGLLEQVQPFAESNAGAAPGPFHCDACRDWFGSARRHAAVLGGLTRLSVEFDGRVVAELNAGRRQDRAVAALRWMRRREVPLELDVLVRQELRRASLAADFDSGEDAIGRGFGDRSAPAELDRRVAAEFLAAALAGGGRPLKGLPRLPVPAELDARVGADLRRQGLAEDVPLRRWLVAAAALLTVAALGAMWQASERAGKRGSRDFQVVRANSLADLDPLARGLLSAQLGGAMELASAPRAEDRR